MGPLALANVFYVFLLCKIMYSKLFAFALQLLVAEVQLSILTTGTIQGFFLEAQEQQLLTCLFIVCVCLCNLCVYEVLLCFCQLIPLKITNTKFTFCLSRHGCFYFFCFCLR